MYAVAWSCILFLAAAVLTAALFGAVTPVAAQQSADVEVTDTTSPRASAPATVLPGPRVPALVQPVRPMEARISTERAWPLAAQGGRHTIVISTLALVLAVIIIVLLIK